MRREPMRSVLARGFFLASLIVAAGPGLSRGQTAADLSHQCANARNKGNFAEALRLARQGIGISEASGNQVEIAYWENEIGFNCIELGRFKEAEPALKRAIELQMRISGNDSDQVLLYRGNLAKLYQSLERYDEAETILRQTISIREENLGKDSPDLVLSIHDLAELLMARGRYQDCDAVCKRALAICEASFGSVHQRTAECLKTLGDSAMHQAHYDEAEKLQLRALRIQEALLVLNHPQIAFGLNSLAFVYMKQGKFNLAVPLLKRASAILVPAFGPDNPNTLTVTSNIARAYGNDSRFDEAEALFKQVVAGYRKTPGPATRGLAIALANLSANYLSQNRYAEAESGYREAIKAMEATFGPNHPETTAARMQLSWSLLFQNKIAEAREIADRALAADVAKLGADHPDTAFVYDGLAHIAERAGQLDEAVALLTRVITIQDKAEISPGTRFVSYHHRSIIYWKLGRRDEAIADLKKALELAEQRRTLSAGTARDRAQRYGSFARAFERMVEWQVALGHPDEAFQTIERFRARSFLDEMASVGVVKHAEPAPTNRGDLAEEFRAERLIKEYLLFYEKHREELLKTKAPDDFEVKSNDQQIANTRKELEAIQRKLKGPNPVNDQVTPAIFAAVPTPAEFVRKIGSKTLLLDYLIGEDGGYVVVVGSGSTRVVPLVVAAAEAKTLGIEPGPLTARRLKDALIGAKGDGVLSELARPATSGNLSAKLSVLWRVLIPEADREALVSGTFENLIVAPDGSLTLLPFEALVVEDGPDPTYLLDAGPAIAYAPSAAVLSQLASRSDAPARNQAQPVLTLGNPAYPAVAVAPPMKPSDELAPKYQLRSTGIKFDPLPFTAWETTWVAQAFGERGRPALTLSGSTATESAVRLNAPGRRLVHLACHGITEQAYGNSIGALVMTPGPKGDADPADDGFLTLPEVYGLDLKGCELAILSACQTNIGPQQKGEGNWTLSRGFLVAGARRVVASDWLVDDQAAASLVSIFSSMLATREKDGAIVDHAKALHDAKLWARKQEKWKAPYFWASMVLVGPPRNLTTPQPNLPPARNGGPGAN